MASIKERFEWLIRFLIVRWRFVHHILGLLTKTADPNLDPPTMGVTVVNGNMKLFYNPDFVKELSDAELVYVLYHEVGHLVLHHCTFRRLSNHKLGNIAQDLAVNELIPVETGSCVPPKGICLVSEFQKLNGYDDMKNMQSAEYYYDYLQKKGWGQEAEGTGGKAGKGEGTGKDSKGNRIPQVRSIDNHDRWKADEIADTRLREQVKNISRSEMWGELSAGAQMLIEAAQVQRFNWRSLVKQFLGAFATSAREVSLRRPNRRMGYLLPGNKRLRVDKHLVVIDTSGSTMSFLPNFLAIVNSMLDYLNIDLAQCDAAIVEQPKPFTKHAKEFKFSGMGGTNFQPIIDLVNEKHYRSVSIVTDGQACVCEKPMNADVLWVLPEGCMPPVEWGRIVHINKER